MTATVSVAQASGNSNNSSICTLLVEVELAEEVRKAVAECRGDEGDAEGTARRRQLRDDVARVLRDAFDRCGAAALPDTTADRASLEEALLAAARPFLPRQFFATENNDDAEEKEEEKTKEKAKQPEHSDEQEMSPEEQSSPTSDEQREEKMRAAVFCHENSAAMTAASHESSVYWPALPAPSASSVSAFPPELRSGEQTQWIVYFYREERKAAPAQPNFGMPGAGLFGGAAPANAYPDWAMPPPGMPGGGGGNWNYGGGGGTWGEAVPAYGGGGRTKATAKKAATKKKVARKGDMGDLFGGADESDDEWGGY